MNLVFFTHPDFLSHQSMPRFSGMLSRGMVERGYKVETWSPQGRFVRLPGTRFMKKWLGYIDQFILFPMWVRAKLKTCPPDTLFIFTDNALGPWVPLVADRPHVIHCHDFLAQRSALGEIPENPLTLTGRLYQKYIQRGYSKGKHFISGSENTKLELRHFLPADPKSSDVVYNGMNQKFEVQEQAKSRALLSKEFGIDLTSGYFLHVGGNVFYKNRTGIIAIYDAWRAISNKRLPLLMIGERPSESVSELYEKSPFKSDIHFLSGVNDQNVRLAYSGATVFLFPSLAEGFGWPIAEAMACGSPVITTAERPMTEVAGKAGFYIPLKPRDPEKVPEWAENAATVVNKVVDLSADERSAVIAAGLLNVKRFDTKMAIDNIEDIYKTIVKTSKGK